MFRFLARFFAKFFGACALCYFKVKLTFNNPSQRFFHLKGPLILLAPHRSKHDFLLYSLLVPFQLLHPICFCEGSSSFKRWAFAGFSLEEGGVSFFKKKRLALALYFSKEEEEAVFLFAKAQKIPVLLLSNDGNYGWWKRVHVNVGEPFLLEETSTLDGLRRQESALLEQNHLYQKYHAFGLCHLRDFIYDFGRLAVLPKMALLMPTHYLYVSPAAKKNRHPKGAGIAISNHRAFADAQMLPRLYPSRRIRFVVGDIVYRNNGSLMHFWLKKAGALHVSDAEANPSLSLLSFGRALELLKCNAFLGIFPEGKINWEGKMEPFQKGAAALALLSGVPLYPSYTLRPYRFFHRQIVVVGEAILLPKDAPFTKASLTELTAQLQKAEEDLRTYGEKCYPIKK